MDKWRYHPGVEALAHAARSGELGEILAIRSYRLGWSNPHKDVDALWILLPHDLAIAYEILGHLPKVKAASTPVRGRQACDAFAVLADAEDEVEVTIEIATSHPGTHRCVCDREQEIGAAHRFLRGGDHAGGRTARCRRQA